ncbi:MAG: MFS transporter [Actinomycetia bacterium]|nr:MFS transporter [Actinomycetes bacterium]
MNAGVAHSEAADAGALTGAGSAPGARAGAAPTSAGSTLGARVGEAPASWRGQSAAVRGWLVAVTVYLAAMFHRSTLGVAGLAAQHRFAITPAQLSVFICIQLGVYAAMQVPTGVLVDRYGPRRLLLAAAGIMAFAQLVFAVAPDYPVALLARAVLGCGDALTYISVLRFAAPRFSSRQFPIVVAVTGMLGSIGNVAATMPLSLLLHGAGWVVTFLSASALSIVTGALVWFVLPGNEPVTAMPRSIVALRAPMGRVLRRVRAAWRTPGTRVGFWVHFSGMSTTTTFAMLWGVPYLEANGFSSNAASAVLLGSVLVSISVGPPIGLVMSRWPASRVPMVMFCCLATIGGWAVLLLGASGHLIIAIVACATSVGAPVSAVGFALVRDYNDPAVVGTATGVVNVAGFSSAVIASLAVGIALDVAGSTSASAYRVAFSFVLAVQLFGTAQMLRWWLRARAIQLRRLEHGESVPVAVERHRFDLR